MADCIFCKFVNHEATPFLVWEDDKHMAFLDANPINPGHVDIITKKHIDNILDLQEQEYSELLIKAKRLAIHLKTITKAKRVGFAVEGFGVPHVHIHLVPVNHGMELNPTRGGPASNIELENMLKELKSQPIHI
jgi:histidine triad (HIT) family protein